MKNRSKIINLIGCSCVGKSTIAAKIFVALKEQGLLSQICPEYIQGLIYSEYPIRPDKKYPQNYIYANQQHLLDSMLKCNIPYIICESPLYLTMLYAQYNDPISQNLFLDFVYRQIMAYEKQYHVYNFLIQRATCIQYTAEGRLQDETRSKEYQKRLNELLEKYPLHYHEVELSRAAKQILDIIQ